MDVAVVGAGIIGLAHAWFASRAGHRVTVFERHPRTMEATVRNFGMIWPIGQPPGELYQTAKRSRDLWVELGAASGFWVNECGSIHLAHHLDEMAVLEEFVASAATRGVDCHRVSGVEIHRRTHGAIAAGLLGGMWSPTELAVNPRRVPERFANFLVQKFQVQFRWNTPIVKASSGELYSGGECQRFDKIVIASGSEMKLLFPEVLANSGLRQCKLQMLKTVAAPGGRRIGPHIASGLTLRHYASFAHCPSLAALKSRVAAETSELDRFGIHVMVSQNEDGEFILGDSHEYDGDIEPFQKAAIDELILRELRKIIHLPDWTIAERWEGIYVKHPERHFFSAEPEPGVHLFTGVGGAGMTFSLGLAEQFWSQIQ
jgi:FAD dependent oxidoreductase TIGR03364